MGIKGLMSLLKSEAPTSYQEVSISKLRGKKVAIDATILLYQFVVQIRTDGSGYGKQLLMDKDGDTTSHLQGFLYRTTYLLENGIKPIFVFDGKPPELKFKELARRRAIKDKADKDAMKALDDGNIDDYDKASKRSVKITSKHVDDVVKLLKCMGIPYLIAPCEAEAECSDMSKRNIVDAVGTEDMDALTFGSKILYRKLTGNTKDKVIEINYSKVIEELELNKEQFIDLCILCGCDYIETIKGIGPKNALKLIRKYGSIEEVFSNVSKYEVPDDYIERLDSVRKMFTEHETSGEVEFEFGVPNRESIVEYLVNNKGFNEERVNKVVDRILVGKKKSIVLGEQRTIDMFFTKVN